MAAIDHGTGAQDALRGRRSDARGGRDKPVGRAPERFLRQLCADLAVEVERTRQPRDGAHVERLVLLAVGRAQGPCAFQFPDIPEMHRQRCGEDSGGGCRGTFGDDEPKVFSPVVSALTGFIRTVPLHVKCASKSWLANCERRKCEVCGSVFFAERSSRRTCCLSRCYSRRYYRAHRSDLVAADRERRLAREAGKRFTTSVTKGRA